MPTVVIKLSSGVNKTIEVPNFDISVAELKELAAADIDIPADQQRPVFRGKMIKDHDKLSTLGVTEGNAIHVVRGRGAAAPHPAPATAPATSATAETPSTPRATPDAPTQAPPNPYASLFGGNTDGNNSGFGGWGAGGGAAGGDAGANNNFNNPAAMMAGMNPQLLQQMMQSMGGGGGGMPGAGGAGGGAEQAAAMQMMNNPQMMNMVSQMVAQNPQFVLQSLSSNPMFQNMPPQQREMLTQIMSNPQMFQQMMQLSQAFGAGGGGMPSGNPMAGNGGGAGGAAGGMPDISALFGGGAGAGGAGAGGGGGRFGIPPVANPREAYATQLSQLSAMGFPNEQANIAALQMSQGNVEFAIERLLSGGM